MPAVGDKPGILFAAPMSLLDITSGAALSVRTLLATLAARGHGVVALQAQLFDSVEGGERVSSAVLDPALSEHAVLRATSQGVEHIVVRTGSRHRAEMTAREEDIFINRYRDELQKRRPGLVILWGGMLLEAAIMREARSLGIPVVFYLVNDGYRSRSTFRDVSVIVTDTQATADLYKERLGLECRPVGKFVDPAQFMARQHQPEFITFINPSLEKGVNVFMPLARLAAREAPGIRFMVVQSRGRWAAAVQALGYAEGDFPNVQVVETQANMKPVYGATRVLLVPSVWHESGGRVVVEALLNGIPLLVSDCGGPVELAGAAATVFKLPQEVKDKRDKAAGDDVVRPWLAEIRRLCSEPQYYAERVAAARNEASRYDLQRNTDRFLEAVGPAVQQGEVTGRAVLAHQARQALPAPQQAIGASAAAVRTSA